MGLGVLRTVVEELLISHLEPLSTDQTTAGPQSCYCGSYWNTGFSHLTIMRRVEDI